MARNSFARECCGPVKKNRRTSKSPAFKPSNSMPKAAKVTITIHGQSGSIPSWKSEMIDRNSPAQVLPTQKPPTFMNAIRPIFPNRSTLLSLALLLVSATLCRAEQFVLFDVTFNYTKADADNATPSKSHYYVKGDRLNPER